MSHITRPTDLAHTDTCNGLKKKKTVRQSSLTASDRQSRLIKPILICIYTALSVLITRKTLRERERKMVAS